MTTDSISISVRCSSPRPTLERPGPDLRFSALAKLLKNKLLAMTHLIQSKNLLVIRSDGIPRTGRAGRSATNPSFRHSEQIWIEDSIPAGANVYGTWTWDTTKKASGTQSSTIGPGSGLQGQPLEGRLLIFAEPTWTDTNRCRPKPRTSSRTS